MGLMRSSAVFALMVVAFCEDLAPWIAILGAPNPECSTLHDRLASRLNNAGGSCFTSVYDKWIQGSGARAVGIPHDAFDSNRTALDEILRSVNGVLFTGGGLDLKELESPYHKTASYIFGRVKTFNDAGVHYPLHAHCMGFQLLNILAAEDNTSVLTENAFDSESLSIPLEWTGSAKHSPWVQAMPQEVYNTFTNENSTENLHHDGVTPEAFFTNPLLPNFFNVLSTNHDRQGVEFLSTVESKKYPIRAIQWHPERNTFEWKTDQGLNHSAHATAANMWMGSYFVNEARRNEPQNRNMDLLRQFITYSMDRETVGDVVLGYEYLHFAGFGTAATTIV